MSDNDTKWPQIVAQIEAQFRAKSLQMRQDAQRLWQAQMSQANALDRAATMLVMTQDKRLIENIKRAFDANEEVQLWGMDWDKVFGLNAPDACGDVNKAWMEINLERFVEDILTAWRWKV